MSQTVLSVVLEAQSKGLSTLRELIEQLKHEEENLPPSLHRLLQPAEEPRPHAALHVHLGVRRRPFRSRAGDRGEFRRAAGSFLGAAGGGDRSPASRNPPLLRAARGPDRRGLRPDHPAGLEASAGAVPGGAHRDADDLPPGQPGPRPPPDRPGGQAFFATQEKLGNGAQYRSTDAVTLHRTLRSSLRGSFDWLGEPEPVRIPGRERLADLAKLAGFVMAALLVLSFPGVLLALVVPNGWLVVIVSLLAALATGRLIKDLPDLFRQFSGSEPAPVSGPPPRMRDAFARDAAKSAGPPWAPS